MNNSNETLLAAYNEIEVIKLRAERLCNPSQNKTRSGDLQYVLQKLEEISKFLQPN
jgi:hypothetical protein